MNSTPTPPAPSPSPNGTPEAAHHQRRISTPAGQASGGDRRSIVGNTGNAVGVIRLDRHGGNQVTEAVHEMVPAFDEELPVAVEDGPDTVAVLGLHMGEFL